MSWKTVFRAWHQADVEFDHYRREAVCLASYRPSPEFTAARSLAERRQWQRARFWRWLAKRSDLPGSERFR